MRIVKFCELENKEIYLEKLENCPWDAGKYLGYLLKSGELKKLCGEHTEVYCLLIDEELVSFCTLADFDDIQPTSLTPWIGFVYTYENYRGNRYSIKLMEVCEQVCRENKVEYVYVSTNHIGLYEKGGYEFFQIMKDIEGSDSRVYRKKL